MNTIAKELAAIGTLADLSENDRIAVASICHTMKIKKGTVIAREGLDAGELFAILQGEVAIWVEYGSENADLLAITKAPNLVGEMSVADELPRSATIVTQTDVSGYSMDADEFRHLLQEHGTIAMSLMKGISRIVRSSNDSFVSELRNRNKELITMNQDLQAAQKQLLRQERLSSLGKFSSMIMHDLRNPLSVIKAYADMLELKLESSDDNSLEIGQYTTQIRRETIRLTGLTNEWLDYSRGEIHLAYSPTKTADLFEHLKDSAGAALKAKKITVTWENTLEEVVLLDTDRILRVLINLVDNALKACSKNGSIVISATKKEDRLCLAVKDDGIGMDSETKTHAFDPFYSKTDYGGTGLGMHIVKTVAEAHDGTVEIQSTLGEGTEVSVYLPLRL